MRANKSMQEWWSGPPVRESAVPCSLEEELAALAGEALLETSHGVVLRPLAQAKWEPGAFPDETGYEAYANKIHIADFLSTPDRGPAYVVAQGILYAEALRERLKVRDENFCIILSLDPDSVDVTVRFHMVRPEQQWLADDMNGYAEGIIAWQSKPSADPSRDELVKP